ncbi:NAD-dependent protein deacylase [Oceanivirga miroungae]|uniref:NAD-dependent protein deacetylase n=1 Tax=Oceanivirga miroungae TaxID=1130046 RepID=A0A6I8M6C0_9FUSO|nr:NAD-dependent protein deacylase [Oceanivirga miroungae]VWL84984.1 silent information regulator protein Sir2 [Oceanivirga miroungae]
MEDKIKKLQEMYDKSNNIVFLGGAGVSTESGIPDFRGVDGLYNKKYDYPPETILSNSFFKKFTKEFFKFYREKLIIHGVLPNDAHKTLAKMEEKGKLKYIVTQNIDGLHQLAGSKNVLELHGSIQRNYCLLCGEFYNLSYIDNSKEIPKCNKCDGIVKPDVTLYEEALNEDVVYKAIKAISKADMLIVAGTSLLVYPAASFIRYFKGPYLVIINTSKTSSDIYANLIIRDKVAKVLSKLNV